MKLFDLTPCLFLLLANSVWAQVADTEPISTRLFDVRTVPQSILPNLANFNGQTSITVLPAPVDPTQPNGVNALLNNPLDALMDDQALVKDDRHVIELLSQDPSRTVPLPLGERIVVVDTGTVSTLGDFTLKAFGNTRSRVSISSSSEVNMAKLKDVESWNTLVSTFEFDADNPLVANMNGQQGRFLRIVFNTSQPGPVGALRITSHRQESPNLSMYDVVGFADRPRTGLLGDLESSGRPPGIAMVTHVSAGPLENIKYLIDDDFRTVYSFKEQHPAVCILETNVRSGQFIERVSVLFADDSPAGVHPGIVEFYSLEHLPFEHFQALKGDGPTPQQVELARAFFQNNQPVATINVAGGKTGGLGSNLKTAINSPYLLVRITGNGGEQPQLSGPRQVASIYAGPQSSPADQILRSEALLSQLQSISTTVLPVNPPPTIPPATSITP